MKRNKNNNIVHASLEELTKLGYGKRRSRIMAGDLLCAVNSAQNVWIELSDSDIKLSKVNPNDFFILGK